MFRTISKRLIEKKIKLFVCFIDYAKAFDKVNHNKRIEIMQKTGIPQRETQLIANLYFKQRAKIIGKEILSESFPIEKGVRQGCILSPILFNLYSEVLIKDALQDEDEIKINGESITTIRYGDDTAILAEKEEDLQRMMDTPTLRTME